MPSLQRSELAKRNEFKRRVIEKARASSEIVPTGAEEHKPRPGKKKAETASEIVQQFRDMGSKESWPCLIE